MRFVKIDTRNKKRLAQVIECLIKQYKTPHAREGKHIISLGFPECGDNQHYSNYTKIVGVDNTHIGSLHYFETSRKLYLDICYEGKSLYTIDILL